VVVLGDTVRFVLFLAFMLVVRDQIKFVVVRYGLPLLRWICGIACLYLHVVFSCTCHTSLRPCSFTPPRIDNLDHETIVCIHCFEFSSMSLVAVTKPQLVACIAKAGTTIQIFWKFTKIEFVTKTTRNAIFPFLLLILPHEAFWTEIFNYDDA